MNELRTIDFNKSSFECGGETWTVSEKISFERYKKLQELLIEFGFSATFKDIFSGLRRAWDLLNALKLGDASVVIHNLMNGIKNMEQKHDTSLRICALFINRDGEDLSDASDTIINSKIDIWAKELDVTPFFHFAAALSKDWIAAYNVFTQSTSKVAAQMEKDQDILTSTKQT
jgi:hypothetical protein